MRRDERKPLAYHFASEEYGRGVCGTYGMMAISPMSVTCERCLKTPQFAAALSIAGRYAGSAP